MSVAGWRGVRQRGQATRALVGTCLLSALLASPAAAQQGAGRLVPVVTPLGSDDAWASAPGALSAIGAFAPLQLSLVGGLFAQGSKLPGCASREDASGNSVDGFALQRYSYLRLTPRLVLNGFSLGGCAVDAGLGGGLTFSEPLTKSLWLVSSVGLYTLPPLDSARSALVTGAERLDVVKRLAWGRTLSVGLGVRQRTGTSQFNAIHFGGSF